jgi:hypothetical protein
MIHSQNLESIIIPFLGFFPVTGIARDGNGTASGNEDVVGYLRGRPGLDLRGQVVEIAVRETVGYDLGFEGG